MMKRLTAIFLLSSLLMTQTDLRQLLRFPLLISHYLEHKFEKPDMSVADFIRLHYFSKFVKDKDYMDDLRLPFKSHTDVQLLSTSSAVIPQNLYISVKAAELDIVCSRSDYSEDVIHGVIGPIWQPPKFC